MREEWREYNLEERISTAEEKKEMVKVETFYERLDDEIDRAAASERKVKVDAFLGGLFTTLEVGRNLKKIINPDLDYVVKFSPELIKKMEEHDIQFLKDKLTGELLPDLYDYTAKGIGGKVRLEIKGIPTGQDIANLSNALNNFVQQQRYEALVEEIQQLHIAAKRIERGQDNDRFAKVEAGRKHLIDAINYQGTEEERKKLIFDALAMLREGRELIEKTLLDKLNKLETVPEGKIKRLWKCFSQPDYFGRQTYRYDDIQEYFQYYIKSIKPMAYVYTYLDQPVLIESLLEDSRKVFEHPKIKFLSTVEYLLPEEDFTGRWYKNPMQYEQKLISSYRFGDENEDLLISVNGSEILEVCANGEEGKKEYI